MLNVQFLLTPTLSLRKREHRPPRAAASARLSVFRRESPELPVLKGRAEREENVRERQRGSLRSARARNLPIILSLALAIALLFGCTSPGDSNPQIYDTHADGEKQLAEALRQAQAEHKRVLLDLGANWCSDSQAMFRLLSTNREIQRFISDRYVFDLIDVNQRGLHSRNTRLLERLGNPITNGIPVLLILDENGMLLNSDPDERLRDSDHEHPLLVLSYLRKWAGQR